MTEGANAGAIKATIDFDAAGLEAAVNKAMKKATGQIEDSIDRSMNDVQDTMKRGFRNVGAGILGFLGLEDIAGGLRQLGGWVLRMGQETESGLNMFRAVSGATADEMTKISDLAKELGNDISLPGTSAADAAMAMTELAKAGFSVDESMIAAKGTLQLATAAQIDAGRAAEISSKQLQAFGLETSQAGQVADILANAANETSADMEGMSESLNQVGAVAHASGFSLTETAAAVALMADNAIIGSDAGTSLKSMLVALQAPTGKAADLMKQYGIEVYDQQGRMKSLSEITAELTTGTADLTDKQRQYALATIFGTDGIRAVNVLMNQGADGVAEMSTRLEEQGAAAKLAEANSKGLVGALGALQSTAESVAIEVYQKVAPAFSEWIRGGLEDLPGLLDDIGLYLGEVGDSLAPVASLLVDFAQAAKPGAVIAFKAALAAVLGVLQAVEVVLGPVAELVESNEDAFRSIVGALVAATLAYKVMNGVVRQGQAIYTSPAWGKATANVKSLSTSMKSATTMANGFRTASAGAVAAVGGPWGLAIGAAAIAVGIFASEQANARAEVDLFADSLDEQTGALTENTRAVVARQLIEEHGWDTDRLHEYGVTIGEVTDAVMQGGDALKHLQDKIIAVETEGGIEGAVKALNLLGDIPFRSDSAQDFANTLGDVSDRLRQSTEETRLLAQADRNLSGGDALEYLLSAGTGASQYADDAKGASGATRLLGDQVVITGQKFQREADAANAATRAIKGLREESIKGLNAQIDFEAAADNLRATIKGLTPESIKSGKALDIQSARGREVYRAFLDLASSSANVEGGMARARQQIFNTIRPMVESKAEANRLTNQFFDLEAAARNVPDRVDIRVSANVSSAIASLTSVIPVVGSVMSAVNAAQNAAASVSKRKKGHAGGGPVYGPGTGVSDDVLRRLSDGEHVFRAKEVQAAGGHDGIFAIRAALTRGGLAAVAELAGGGGALVENLAVSVGSKDDLPDALDETMFHLRRIRRGSRYL